MPTPKSNKKFDFRQLLWIPVFVVLVAIGARASFKPDIDTIFTLQTLFMSLCFYYMPGYMRLPSILSYLLVGVLGLAVFSDGGSGWDHINNHYAGGYFVGFIAASFLKTPSDSKWQGSFGYFILIHLVVVVFGVVVLAYGESNISLIPKVLYSLSPGIAIKSVLAVILVLVLERFRLSFNRRNSG
jgi:biotin transport system substrate-specific component